MRYDPALRLLRLTFALAVAAFFWACVGGLVYVVAFQGGLPLRGDPLRAARQRALRGDVAGAEREYRVATLIEPTDVIGLCELGELLARAGRYDDALAAFQRALDVRLDARALAGSGDVLFAKQDFARAAHAYQLSLSLSPQQPALLGRLESARRLAASR